MLNETIRQAVLLERYKKHEVQAMVDYLQKEVLPDVYAQVESLTSGIGSRGVKAAKLKQLLKMQERVKATLSTALLRMPYLKNIEELALSEAKFAGAMLEDVVGVAFGVPSIATLRAVSINAPVLGTTLFEKLEDLSVDYSFKALAEVRKGLILGETVQDMTKRLIKKAPTKFASTIVRTSINHVSASARQATYEENAEFIEGIEILATLDTRTSEICMGYDGEVFPIDSGPRPPFHPNCRTTIIPVVMPFTKLKTKEKLRVPETKRASMNGEVSGKTTYGSWLKKQSAAIQDEALGPTRGALFRDGTLNVGDLKDKFGDAIALPALYKRLNFTQAPDPLELNIVHPTWPADLVNALHKYNDTTGSSKSYWKKQSIKFGWSKNTKLPKNVGEAVKNPFRGVNAPQAYDGEAIKNALDKYGTAASASSKTYWKKKAIEAGHVWGETPDPIPNYVPPPQITKTKPVKPKSKKDKLKETSDAFVASLGGKQYDELHYTSASVDKIEHASGWTTQSPEVKAIGEELQSILDSSMSSKAKTQRMLKSYQKFKPTFEGKFSGGATWMDPRATMTFLLDEAKYFDGMPDHLPTGVYQGIAVRRNGVFGMSSNWGQVTLNKTYYNNEVFDVGQLAAQKQYDAAIARGELPHFSQPGTVAHVSNHEFGHHLGGSWAYRPGVPATPLTLPPELHAFGRANKSFKEAYLTQLKKGRKPNLSKYGTTNLEEAWAEGWAKMVETDPAEWDWTTQMIFDAIQHEYNVEHMPLPYWLRKKAASTVPKGYTDTSSWKRLSAKKGSNDGGLFADENGKQFYVKFVDKDHLDNEVIANRMYREAGLATPEVHHGWHDGKPALISEWQEGLEVGGVPSVPKEGFVTDAWLANWDVVGMGYDNLTTHGGAPFRIDAGGSMLFRAQGASKGHLFGDVVNELETMLDPARAPQAAKVFGGITDEELYLGILRVEKVTDERIDAIVKEYWRGGGDDHALAWKLKARRNNLLAKKEELLQRLTTTGKIKKKLTHKAWLEDLTQLERDGIGGFTGGHSSAIRKYQITGEGNEYTAKLAENMEKALLRGPVTEGEIYRGISAGPEMEWAAPLFNVGETFVMKESASFSHKASAQYSKNVQIVVYNKKTAVKTSSISSYKNEFESTSRPNSKFRVQSARLVVPAEYPGTEWLFDDTKEVVPAWCNFVHGQKGQWLITLEEV